MNIVDRIRTAVLPLAAGLVMAAATSCERQTDAAMGDAAGLAAAHGNARLEVRTRAAADQPGDAEAPALSYPIQVYVFRGDACAALQNIGDAGQQLSLTLPEGQYQLAAIGGASATDYVLPAAGEATPASIVALREGHSHHDLQTCLINSVALEDGQTNTVTLGMERRVMQLRGVTIGRVPAAATAVSVSISPLYGALTAGAALADGGQAYTIALERQSDGRTWTAAPEAYLLPPSAQPVTVSVSITTAEGTRTYTYASQYELEAGWRITLSGTCTDDVDVELTGTITAPAWKGERTITFGVGSGGSGQPGQPGNSGQPGDSEQPGDSGDSGQSGEAPAEGALYEHCYVVSATTLAGSGTRCLLLSPKAATTGMSYSAAQVAAGLADTFVAGLIATAAPDDTSVTSWRLPTRAELDQIQAVRAAATTALEADGGTKIGLYDSYVIGSPGAWQGYSPGMGTDPAAGFLDNDKVRPVATVDFP